MGIDHTGRYGAADLESGGFVRQRTLKSAINCSGVALHSGKKVTMALIPAEPDTGILFRRTDIVSGDNEIPARWDRVVDTRLCTAIANDDGVSVGTVEHLMSALSGCGIDNVVIELNAPEVPIMDGSAAPFVFLIECAGVVSQDAPRKVIRVLKTVTVDDGERAASLTPGNGFSLAFEIDFASTAIRQQAIAVGMADGTFKNEVARARTFGFLHEVEQLWAAGLAKGGSLENAVVVSGDKVLNEDGLRYDDEFVRHKVLDAVGDLYLAGAPIQGHFHGACSGHATNNALLRALFADPSAWAYDVERVEDGLSTPFTGVHALTDALTDAPAEAASA
ncbi:MAG: UDP-3-O-acyl-N-acetylglucosamine deacetylase [Rhodobacterales bacterium]|nr:UDP-3-O-acyl-N-acetylglucosamine deacetylase [Rhodobacterales bacterium]